MSWWHVSQQDLKDTWFMFWHTLGWGLFVLCVWFALLYLWVWVAKHLF